MLLTLTARNARLGVRVSSQRGQLCRDETVRLSAGRRLGHEKRNTKKQVEPRQCPCGSGMQFRECCGPIVGGAWARTAPELARARFTAVVLGDTKVLVDTTHPEALHAIGTKEALRKKVVQSMRFKRGAGERPPALADSVHGQSPNDPNSWYVLLAVAVGPPGLEKIYAVAELYCKDAGRWWFMGEPREFPALKQFEEFLQRYWEGDEDGGVSPFQGRYNFLWQAFPPRALPDAEAQHRRPWLVDDWPEGDGASWVYLDTAVDPETGLTAAQSAAQSQRLVNDMLRHPNMDWDSFFFRRGCFVE